MNPTDFGSNRFVISPNPHSPRNCIYLHIIMVIMKRSWQNPLDPSPHIKSPEEIYIYAYRYLKNIDIVTKVDMKTYFVNLNHITKFCYGRKRIKSKTISLGPLIGPIMSRLIASFSLSVLFPQEQQFVFFEMVIAQV